jgi:hypothetical protein
LRLADWLREHQVTRVAEATDVYWKPVWHVLEGRFELLLVRGRSDYQRMDEPILYGWPEGSKHY